MTLILPFGVLDRSSYRRQRVCWIIDEWKAVESWEIFP